MMNELVNELNGVMDGGFERIAGVEVNGFCTLSA